MTVHSWRKLHSDSNEYLLINVYRFPLPVYYSIVLCESFKSHLLMNHCMCFVHYTHTLFGLIVYLFFLSS